MKDAPGAHAREIERLAGLGYGAVDYHLRRLERDGLIRSETAEKRKLYFATDFPKQDRALAAAIRAEPARRVLVALLSMGELNHGDLAVASGLGLSTVSVHALRLARKGLVRAREQGRHTFFALADPARVERILIRHGHSVGDRALDAYITLWSELRRPRARPPPPVEEPAPATGGPPQ